VDVAPKAVPVAGVFVCWLPVSVPVTALLPTPPLSPAAIAVAAPVINNDATPRICIVFVMKVFVIKITPAAGLPRHHNAARL
jgi:hypothetical protein